jgi:hypothetical protein
MNIFSSSPQIITISSKTTATVSDRVEFNTQNTQFESDPNGSQIAFIPRANYDDLSQASKKGFYFQFDRNIQSGTYSVTAPDFPFKSAHYFEWGTLPGLTTIFDYKPKSGSISVEALENSGSKLHYLISFDFIGKNQRNEELKIVGKSTFIVLMRSVQS